MHPTNQARETRYVVISAVRNEGAHIEETFHSVLRQTVRPAEWVLVDDGSTDQTARIIDRYRNMFPWISALHRPNRGHREPGTGVMEAFHQGYESLKSSDWEFVVKLDGDLCLGPDYFEKCFEEFRKDVKLGIGGGVICHEEGNTLREEPGPLFHVRGATKIYRRSCWDALGGLLTAPGWDTVDEVKANMLGWHTRSFPHLKVLHRRRTGAADGAWRNWVKNGRANYISGYHPLFMLVKCLKRTVERPPLVGAAGLLYGYLSGYIRGVPQVKDPALIGYIRRQQIRRLLLLKSIWK